MTFKYGLSDAWCLDSFRKLSKKEFTFDNGRSGASSALSRIDKFLVSQSMEERRGRIEVAASVKKLLDHSPLVISVWGKHLDAPRNRPGYFDSSFLSEVDGRKELWEAWIGNHPPTTAPSQDFDWSSWLEAATGRVMACNACLSKARRRAQGACVRANTKKIQLAEVQLPGDPTNIEVRDILSNAQGQLADVFQNSVERIQHSFASRWLRYGDICSKAFFDFHRIGTKRVLLRELEIEEGLVTGQSDLALYIMSFYANLYTSDAQAPGTAKAQSACWTSVPTKVTQVMNERLTRELTIKEVSEAIRALPKGKAPRHDGVPMEFFHEFVNEVAPTLFHAFAAMLNAGSTSAHINKGMITLIPKSGDRARLNNWRPITLLGSIYKILAKTLA